MRPSTRLATAALAALACVAAPPRYDRAVNAQEKPAARLPSLTAPLVDDFQVNGTGDHASWTNVAWTPLRRRQPDGSPYETRFKCVYSTTGIYFLDGRHRPQAHGHHERRLHGPLERGRVRGLSLDRRAASGLLRVPRSRRSTGSCRF